MSFFSREELLGGLPARRASTLLFAIESRTAQLMQQSRQAMATYLTEQSAAEQERAFLSALAQGRDLPLQPKIQDIERYAPAWATLVPPDANLRAAIFRLIGEKYRFRYQDVPLMRQALGLDDEGVQRVFQNLHDQPLDSVFASSVGLPEQLRWTSSRVASGLENLPPFWTAFSLTLTETVGAGILALPIAMAGVGPLPGAALLFVFGLINILTIVGIVEAIVRNGNMRYGNAYFGRLVNDYLGRPGQLAFSPVLVLQDILILLAYYVGLSTTLTAATSISPMLWAAVLFLFVTYFLSRQTINATVASALVIGAINIFLILILSFLALSKVQVAHVLYVNLPFNSIGRFDPSLLGLIFGIVLVSYFGHTSAGRAAGVVLRRDPGGRTLIWGSVAAMICAMVLASLWVVAVNGAISPAHLARTTGTALIPLAAAVFFNDTAITEIYTVLAMGLGSIHFSLSLFYQIREWLPANLNRRLRFGLGLSPLVLMLVLVEWLLLTGRESFSGPLAFLGTIAVPLVGGVFPILMLAASRRMGDYVPEIVSGFVGHPLVLGIVYVLYLGGVFAHGILIWQDPLQRITAVTVGLSMLGMTALIMRRGAFRSRTIVELRVLALDVGKQVGVTVTASGKQAEAIVKLQQADGEQVLRWAEGEVKSADGLRSVTFELAPTHTRELKVWAHQVTPEGHSEELGAMLVITGGAESQEIDLASKSGQQMVMPFDGGARHLEINLTSAKGKAESNGNTDMP
jgi:amino acid permease